MLDDRIAQHGRKRSVREWERAPHPHAQVTMHPAPFSFRDRHRRWIDPNVERLGKGGLRKLSIPAPEIENGARQIQGRDHARFDTTQQCPKSRHRGQMLSQVITVVSHGRCKPSNSVSYSRTVFSSENIPSISSRGLTYCSR